MSWTAHVQQSQGILEAFQGQTPDLDEVEIREVVVEDLRAVRLRFDLGAFPEQPPAKWVAGEANVAQVDLGLGDLSHLAITGALGPAIGTITIGGESPSAVEINAVAGTFRVEAVGAFAWIRRFSAYKKGTSW
jgi:hypothetical protein